MRWVSSPHLVITTPRWLPGNIQYETIMGSVAYGVSSDTSDVDIYGWAVPPRDDVFPHYTPDDFERSFERRFVIDRREAVADTHRMLYLMRRT